MFPIEEFLKVRNNQLDSYLPVRNKNNKFDWDLVTGIVLSHALDKQVRSYPPETYRQDCLRVLSEALEEQGFLDVIDRMYFASKNIYEISPLFLLFRAQYKGSGKTSLGTGNWRLATLFLSLMGDFRITSALKDKLNFIEQEIHRVLEKQMFPITESPFGEEQPYLPYLAKVFQEDLAFLASRPQYLLQELTNTLKLYAFTYCAQLALNWNNWQGGEPGRKPLFFILDTEKASSERAQVQSKGYKLFSRGAKRLFPVLSALEVLQCGETKRPLWQVYSDSVAYLENEKVLACLNHYLGEFIEERKLKQRPPAESLEEAFKMLLSVAWEQFEDEQTERSGVNEKYIKELESLICSDFIQARGRAGRTLVLNQDQLLLLTNLAIGTHEKLRLHELMTAFERRGFYLDNLSRQTLVAFYERMGNVERMSDSGDAVYVRKTV